MRECGLLVFGHLAASAFAALLLFLGGTARYRHFKPSGNPLSRFGQVVAAATKKWKVETPENEDEFYQGDDENTTGGRKMMHTHGFKFLDRAAVVTSKELDDQKQSDHNPWRLCPISQVEEVKCILRLLPIWLCTIIYSVVYTNGITLC